jgi:hypothetical protein
MAGGHIQRPGFGICAGGNMETNNVKVDLGCGEWGQGERIGGCKDTKKREDGASYRRPTRADEK